MNCSKLIFATLLIMAAALSSCTPRLVGSWAIERYETTTPDQQQASMNDIGILTFYENGTGEKDISYSLFGEITNDHLPFNWTTTDKYVTIQSEGSSFSKTWIIIEDQGKFQKWKSTDGGNQVQTLELKKQ